MQKNRKSFQKSSPKAAPTPSKRAKTNAETPAIVETEDVEESLTYEHNLSDDEEGGTRVGDIYIPPPIPPHCSTESKGPRLIIKKITNFNFKSYAGKVVLGPFHHCFTAIIGPNGSGKSNVIDSMLFVFGYRANKIRCKKLSTLLHNSALHPNTKSCSVAVHFRLIRDVGDGECEEVPDSEIIVERVAFADNSSYYAINNRRVQFKEVSKLLKQHHVDLDHNRFLILQGEVESIAMMKPKGQNENECGMLEYLEDIVGTTRYKEPLIKINDRVEKLTEERTEKHNRCKLAERDMRDLEQPYNEAVNYLKQENENTRTKNLRIQKYLSEKKKKLNEYSIEYSSAQDVLKQHDEAADHLKKDREEKEQIIRNEQSEFDKLRQQKENLEKRLGEANNGFTEVQETMTDTNKRRKQNKTQLEKAEEKLIDLKKLPDKNKKEIEESQKRIETLEKQKNEKNEELQKNYAIYHEQITPLTSEIEELGTELVGLKTVVDSSNDALLCAEKQLKILKERETTETRKYESMRSSYEESQENLKSKQEAAQNFSIKMPEIQKEISIKTKELHTLQNEELRMRESLSTLQNEIHEKINLMQTTSSSNRVLDSLMRQKNEGNIPGILGRLGDLGAIESKYDVAISTACGRLDNIVVDTVNTAQECIEYIKKHGIGRASFIPLEKVCYLTNSSGRIQTPEGSPRLYDLVRVEDERILPAFYFALRNTLVAIDLNQGSRIAYGAKRYRVVTLDGDLIEVSGTMSGGGRTQIRGKMGTKVQTKTKNSADNSILTQKALDNMQKTAEELQSKINYNQEQQGRLEREIQILNQTLKKVESDLHKMKVSIKSLDEQLPSIFKRLEEQKNCMKKTITDPIKVKILETDILKKRDKLKESEDAAKSVSQQIEDINKKKTAIGNEKIEPIKSKIKSIGTQINKLNANISKLKSEITTASREQEKCDREIGELKSSITKAEEDIRKLSVKRTKFTEDSAELNKEIEEIRKTIENTKSDSSEIQKEISKIQKLENEGKLKRIEIEQKIQTILAKLNEVKGQIPYWQEQLKPLSLHEIPAETETQLPLKEYTEDELASYTLQDIQYKESVQEEMLKKKPNLSCINEYIEKRDVYLERVKVLEDITLKRNEMRQLYDDVRKKRYNEFIQGFHIITRKLKEMYQMITQGGDAELELVDSMDPFTEGVLFSVRPPRKSWKNISNLSGGEKTLSSLALVFALHYYSPSPLYFMDEIDAALDFKNISIVAHYIKERTKNAQFIIISLRSNMFELSDYLVGIYKVYDCTESLTFKNSPPTLSISQNKITNAEIDEAELDLDNNENVVPTEVRESTFVPNTESTAYSQDIQEDLTNITSCISNTDNDVFKRPLPPPQQEI